MGSFGRFECGAEGDDIAIEWFVDFIGLNANTTEKCFTSGEGREDGTAKSVLCINTTGVNDNVTVQCRAYSGSSADKSREVTLTVQGKGMSTLHYINMCKGAEIHLIMHTALYHCRSPFSSC